METRHIVVFLVVSAITGCFGSSLLKIRKLQAQPHGRHVAHKSGSTSSSKEQNLMTSGSNPQLKNVTPERPEVSTVVKKQQLSAEEKKKKRLKRKRKHWKKEMQSFESLLKGKSKPLKKCKSWDDCSNDECCIRHGKRGYCMKRPQKGHRCKPTLKPGLEGCPCQTGLTCRHFRTSKYGFKKYRCEALKYKEDENEQR